MNSTLSALDKAALFDTIELLHFDQTEQGLQKAIKSLGNLIEFSCHSIVLADLSGNGDNDRKVHLCS